MKLIIDIPEEIVTAIQNGEDYRYDLHTAIAQGIPYEPKGDLINREALKKEIAEFHQKEKERLHNSLWESIGLNALNKLIDNAPTVAVNCKDCDGYEAGYSAGLKDAERPQGDGGDLSGK